MILFLAIVACGTVLRAAYPADRRPSPPDEAAGILALDEAAFLRAVVQPWAHVYVDGRLVATTPTALAVPLTPGRHFVRLENPFFQPYEEEITVRRGQMFTLRATLTRMATERGR